MLTDENKRRVYDQYGEDGIKEGVGSGGGGVDLFDLLSGGMGRRQQEGPKRGPEVSFSLKASLEDIYNGKSTKISINRDRVCAECKGEGGKGASTCGECNGKGQVIRMRQIGPGMYTQTRGPCDECAGEGRVFKGANRCSVCKGKRVVKEKKIIEVTVDKGVPNHHKITYHGESDEAPGVLPGDLIVVVEEKEHDRFKRKKADLIYTKKLTLSEALTGFKFLIRHLDGADKLIQSLPGEIVKPGDVKTVRELGMPLMRTPYKFGNLFIYFEVEFPLAGSLSESAQDQLRAVLPRDGVAEIDSAAFPEKHNTIAFDKNQHITENSSSIHSDYKEDEDEEGPGMKRVQCSGTIF